MTKRISFAALVAAVVGICSLAVSTRNASATVLTSTTSVSYSASGSTGVFAVPFKFENNSDLVVTDNGVTQTLGTHYTVFCAGCQSGATVTFLVNPTAGHSIVIKRVSPFTQTLNARSQGSLSPASYEKALDALEEQIQQVQNLYTNPPATVLPANVTAKLNGIRFADQFANIQAALTDASTTGAVIIPPGYAGVDSYVNTNSIAVLDLRIGSLATGTKTPFVSLGTGVLVRDVNSKLREVFTATDIPGVDPTGVSDSSTGMAAAVAQAIAIGKALRVPAGTYLLKNISITAGVSIEGEGREVVTFKLPVLAVHDGSPILNITASGVAVRGITFDGQKTLQTADGFSDSFNTGLNNTGRAYRSLIKAYNAGGEISGLVIENCKFLSSYGAAIAAQNVSHAKIRRNIGNLNNFETVMLYSTTAVAGATYYAGSEVSDNEITNTGSGDPTTNGNAILLNHASEFTVAHNFAQTMERNGFKCEGCKNGVVRGNTFDSNSVANFGGIQLQQDGANIIIEGNKISNTGAGITLNGNVTGTGFVNDVIAYNTIDTTLGGTTGDGISLTFASSPNPSTGVTIAHNTMKAIQRIGIYVAGGGAWSDFVISGNNIKTTSGGANGQYGINIQVDTAGTTGLVLTNNLIDMNSAPTNGRGLFFSQANAQTLTRATILGNTFIGEAGRVAIDDGNVAIIASGTFGGNTTDGFIRMGSTGLQTVAPNIGTILTSGYWLLGLQPQPVTFANLGTPQNGTIIFCSDCAVAPTCAGSGTGATAQRLNGAWNCNGGGPSNKGTITLSTGSGTATVVSGATCSCTDTTANASVKCAVSATTLTATGTGSDVIAYLCF